MPPAIDEQPIKTDPSRANAWTRAMLLRELRKPVAPFRWEWVGRFLWPIAAVFGILGYKAYLGHGWAFLSVGCALLCFNFAVAAIVSQVTAPYRRKIELLTELVEHLSSENPD